MVHIITITGVTSARTTAIALTNYIPQRVRALISVRQLMRRSYAVAAHTHAGAAHTHAGAAHTHAGAAHTHAGAAHSHAMLGAAGIGVSNAAAGPRMHWSAGLITTSAAHGAVPPAGAATSRVSNTTTRVSNTTTRVSNTTTRVSGAGGVTVQGSSLTNYTIDSLGRVVNTATHPAATHAVLKEGAAGISQIELGDALRSTDLLVISGLLQGEMGGIF